MMTNQEFEEHLTADDIRWQKQNSQGMQGNIKKFSEAYFYMQ